MSPWQAEAEPVPTAARPVVPSVLRRPWHLALGAVAVGLAVAPHAPAPAAAIAVLSAVLALCTALRAPGAGLLAVVALAAGLLAGGARVESIDRPGARLHAGEQIDSRALLLGPARSSLFGWSAEVELLSGRGSAGGARLLAIGGQDDALPRAPPGAILELSGLLREPRPGESFDRKAHLRRRGIAHELVISGLRDTGGRRGGLGGLIDSARARAEGAIGAALDSGGAELMRGMVLGQDERIDPLVRDDFRDSGLAHLLAVSGQNVMLLGALALPVLVLLGLGSAGRTAALLALIAVYVPLAGAGPSLQRAAVMGAAGLVAIAAARPPSRSYALLLAAVVTLLLNPRATGDPGWQLSFAAVAGMVWVEPALLPLFRALPRALARAVALSLAATLATAPLLLHHFGSLPLGTLAANVLALPAVPLVMWAGMLLCAVGQLGGGAGAAHALAKGIGALAGPALKYLSWLARAFAELPGARSEPLTLGSPLALGAAYGVLALIVAGLRHFQARGRPEGARPGHPRWDAGRRLAVAVAGALAVALCTALLLRPGGPPGEPTVRFLDVGQGDATLVQHPGGAAVLFDGGPPEARVYRLVREAGVRRLTAVVATHASRDHHGGLRELIERVPVDLLLDGGDGTPDPGFRQMLAEARARGVEVVPALAPLALELGGIRVRLISPRPRPAGPAPEDPNPRAVVAEVSVGPLELLLSADAESEVLEALPLRDVDAIKVPHHGSSDPGLPAVLDRLEPELAVIEVGENSYGHPAPSTLTALRQAGVRTLRTDRHGTVTLSAPDHGLLVGSER